MAQMENEVQGPSSVSDRVPWDPAGDRGSIWNGNNDLLPICEVANVLKFLHHDDHICNLGDSFCRAESLKI